MHPILEEAKRKIEASREGRQGVPKGYTPPDLRHEKLVTLRVIAGSNNNNQRFEFLIKTCPKCLMGYVFDYTSEADQDIKSITQEQWRSQIKEYKPICTERVENGQA